MSPWSQYAKLSKIPERRKPRRFRILYANVMDLLRRWFS